MRFLLWILILLKFAPSAFSDCLDPSVKAQFYRDFKILMSDRKMRFDSCSESSVPRQTAEAVRRLKTLLPDEYRFFRERIHTVQFETPETNKNCGSYIVAFVMSGTADGVMHVCSNIEWKNWVEGTSFLIHEARHEDPAKYSHVQCEHGFYAGTDGMACDESHSQGGSYAVQVDLLVKLSRLKAIDAGDRLYGRSQAILYLMESFNELPLGMEKGAVLVTEDQEAEFYQGSKTSPLFKVPRGSVVSLPSGTALTVADPTTGKYGNVVGSTIMDQGSIDFKRAGSRDAVLVDLYRDAKTYCRLSTDALQCRLDGEKMPVVPLVGVDPIGFVTQAGEGRTDGIRFAAADGSVYRVPDSLSEFQNFNLDDLRDLTLQGVKNTASWTDGIEKIVLGFDGQVKIGSNPAPGLENRRFRKLLGPYYWSPQLNDL